MGVAAKVSYLHIYAHTHFLVIAIRSCYPDTSAF